MSARILLLAAASAVTIAAGFVHWHSSRTRTGLEADRSRIEAETADARRLHQEAVLKFEASRSELQALIVARATRPAPAAAGNVPPRSTGKNALPNAKSAPPPADPEVRRHQVQTFVSEQRLRFAALLKRLRFTAEQMQDFDRIHKTYQEVILGEAPADPARRQASQMRDDQMKALFGASHDQWMDANRDQPARAIVTQIVQQTFQSSGALTSAQADELARIVGQRRVPSSKESPAGPSRYDWDQIIVDARALLADRQMESFIAAIEYRRASDKMAALASKPRR